ncbi:hypothetical protein KEM60_02290 [Austwickia sp. TVS 96-490-7B]|uniref:DUF3043 domain-containing protein n=1 Tax=Austwickia sp. TVS 96-490-7B TaxID=2830843 RepID=UPI001C55DEBE|nr:DUF3043 domain-containing protein [Austwickia sp. TVS 96-490-7B]MBW3086079.1 hypothetical protein [Austwickia sp. TVS 96-490-7B]
MFGRKKHEETLQEQLSTESPQSRPGAKNRPTPKRREAQAARLNPLVPADRKAAAKAAKQAERAERMRRQEAMRRGEEWALLPRDRGPQRAWIRDMIDVRWNIGEFMLPIMLIGLPFVMISTPNSVVWRLGASVVYGAFAVFILDTILLWFQIRRRHHAKFDTPPARGTFFYVMSRSLSMRRSRLPLPRVNRGQKID